MEGIGEMSKSTYISQPIWRKINPDLRRAILGVLPLQRSDIVSNGKDISWLEEQLRLQGYDDLADRLLKEGFYFEGEE